MNFELAERSTVECIKQTMQMPTQSVVEMGKKSGDLILRDRGSEVNVPDRQAGECLRVA